MVKNRSTRKALWWAGGATAAVLLIFGIRYVAYALSSESTDDAFIEAHVTPISPKVAGQVVAVSVNDNQDVKEGDLLVEIDPRDYEARLVQARAMLDGATAQHKVAQINLEKSRLQLTSVQAD